VSAGATAKRTSWRRISLLEDDLAELDATSGRRGGPLGVVAPPTDHQEAPPVSSLIWEEPPVARQSGAPPPWLAELRSRRGEWAMVMVAKSGSAATTLKKRWKLETAGRRQPDGSFKIYARIPAK